MLFTKKMVEIMSKRCFMETSGRSLDVSGRSMTNKTEGEQQPGKRLASPRLFQTSLQMPLSEYEYFNVLWEAAVFGIVYVIVFRLWLHALLK
jgi:hypothetical protein